MVSEIRKLDLVIFAIKLVFKNDNSNQQVNVNKQENH